MIKVLFQKRLFLDSESTSQSLDVAKGYVTLNGDVGYFEAFIDSRKISRVASREEKETVIQYLNNLQNFIADMKSAVLNIEVTDEQLL